MKCLLITREIQNGFIEAIGKGDIRNWYESNTNLLSTISESLKSLEIPRSQRDKEQICEFICQSFFTRFLVLCGEETDNLRPESYTGRFLLKLKASYVSNDWRQFYNDHEHYFDYLINLARVQKIIDIKIEAKNGTVWDTFHEAKNSIRTPPRSFWFCCVGTVTPPVDQKKKLETEVVTVQPKEHVILPDVIPIPSETGAPELVAVPSENIQNNDSFEDFEKEINKIVNDVTDFRNESIGSKPPATEKEKERPGVHRTPSLSSNTSSLNFTNRCNEADASFRRKLDAQNERFNEEMRKVREKREQMNREAEEDMRQFRKESSRRIQMFLNCIKLRIRWEEQEQEWGDWLKTMRGTVVKVKTTFLDFDHNRKYNDEEENLTSLLHLQKTVQIAYDKLTYEFENLLTLTDRYVDKLFLRVIQRKISQVANKLCDLMEALDEYQDDEIPYSTLKDLERTIDSMEVPTTSELRRICANASEKEYSFVAPPKHPKSYCVINEI